MLVDILNILVVHKLHRDLFKIRYKTEHTGKLADPIFYSKILLPSFTIYVLCFKI
jgi:hypothetical protein